MDDKLMTREEGDDQIWGRLGVSDPDFKLIPASTYVSKSKDEYFRYTPGYLSFTHMRYSTMILEKAAMGSWLLNPPPPKSITFPFHDLPLVTCSNYALYSPGTH